MISHTSQRYSNFNVTTHNLRYESNWMWRPITCVTNLKTRNQYLRNSFRQQQYSDLTLGIRFEVYTSWFHIHLKGFQTSMWRLITCVMSLNIRNHYICNSFRRQEYRDLSLGIGFGVWTSWFHMNLKDIQAWMWRHITCVTSLNTKNYYLRNSFEQPEESNLSLGICFEIYTSRINIYLKENQFECDDP